MNQNIWHSLEEWVESETDLKQKITGLLNLTFLLMSKPGKPNLNVGMRDLDF